jgi:hypothetical protein
MKFLALLGLVAVGTNALRVAEQKHDSLFAWYTFNEKPTGNRCSNGNECDGQRACSKAGWCQGISRPAKNAKYYYNEAITRNQCPKFIGDKNWNNKDYYCDGNRTCSSAGWCQGTAR